MSAFDLIFILNKQKDMKIQASRQTERKKYLQTVKDIIKAIVNAYVL